MHLHLLGWPLLKASKQSFLSNLNTVKSTSLGSDNSTLPLFFFLPSSSFLTRIIFPSGIIKLSCSHHFLSAQLILASNPWLNGLSFVSQFKRNTEDLCHGSAISRLNQNGGRSQPPVPRFKAQSVKMKRPTVARGIPVIPFFKKINVEWSYIGASRTQPPALATYCGGKWRQKQEVVMFTSWVVRFRVVLSF